MKREKKEMMRIQNMIESDRLNVGGGFENLFLIDLEKLIKDYFEIKKMPTLNTQKSKNGYSVSLQFDAVGVKSFNFLPND